MVNEKLLQLGLTKAKYNDLSLFRNEDLGFVTMKLLSSDRIEFLEWDVGERERDGAYQLWPLDQMKQ